MCDAEGVSGGQLESTFDSRVELVNVWSWTADHDLDEVAGAGSGGEPAASPAVAGGFLVEAKNGAWMLWMGVGKLDAESDGEGSKRTRWIRNIMSCTRSTSKAGNVFIGLQQGKSAYWQGEGNTLLAPVPWKAWLLESDPDFSWCGGDEVQVQPPPPRI